MVEVVKRFMDYVKFDTTSDGESNTVPSTNTQLIFAKHLKEEVKSVGLQDVHIDKNGFVMGHIAATPGYEKIPAVGFIAHMDTSPAASGKQVKPRLVKKYDGGKIVLNEAKNIIMSPNKFPVLQKYIGQDIIVTDGTTLLGADDKAGIAEILTAIHTLPQPHGKVCVAFTPDEEIGYGAKHFDVKVFGADFAYTIDGTEIGEFSYETFNAYDVKVHITGVSVHPGMAKNVMINALTIVRDLDSMLPLAQRPEHTEKREGFYHIEKIEGTEAHAIVYLILRDFDAKGLDNRLALLKKATAYLELKYFGAKLNVEVYGSYRNMAEKLTHMKSLVIDPVLRVMSQMGIESKIVPIRGGTDGSHLTFMGLPTPNIFSGAENEHGIYEFISPQTMEKAVQLIHGIIAKIATQS